MKYRNCGSSGLKLPLISLGLWHNFGGKTINPESKKVLFKAFDLGITHFDLANNYGPPYGSAETNFGKIMKRDLKKYRDELLISSKAGYDMWDGPYGEWGSKKHIIASCDQSLKRMNLDYVDIFYSHRFDPNTPLEETADALESIYRSGKAQYIGISSYSSKQTKKMYEILKSRNSKSEDKFIKILEITKKADDMGDSICQCYAWKMVMDGEAIKVPKPVLRNS